MTVHYILQTILDILFPPSAEALIVRSLQTENIQSLYSCRTHEQIITLSYFQDYRIRALIHEAKFHGNTKAFNLLSYLLLEYLHTHSPQMTIFIPIPLSKNRMHTRGYNQVYEILRSLENDSKCIIETSLLVRTRDTPPQTKLSREGRLQNMHNAFRVSDPERVKGKHILIIDDVLTTGATLRAAKAALLPHEPASVTCLAIAH